MLSSIDRAQGAAFGRTAMMVTLEPPVNVVKSAQTAVTMTARPPDIQPNSDRQERSSREDAPLSASR